MASLSQWSFFIHSEEMESYECWCPASFLLFIQYQLSGRLVHLQEVSSWLDFSNKEKKKSEALGSHKSLASVTLEMVRLTLATSSLAPESDLTAVARNEE